MYVQSFADRCLTSCPKAAWFKSYYNDSVTMTFAFFEKSTSLTKSVLYITLFQSAAGRPLFSIDIHPDGSRFAIGGQGECNFV